MDLLHGIRGQAVIVVRVPVLETKLDTRSAIQGSFYAWEQAWEMETEKKEIYGPRGSPLKTCDFKCELTA